MERSHRFVIDRGLQKCHRLVTSIFFSHRPTNQETLLSLPASFQSECQDS